MIAKDLRIIGFSSLDWQRIGGLLLRRKTKRAFIFVDETQVVVDGFSAHRGLQYAIEQTRAQPTRFDSFLEGVQQQTADFEIFRIDHDILREVSDALGAMLVDHRNQALRRDVAQQALALWSLFRSQETLGRVQIYRAESNPPRRIPVPTATAMQRALNIVLPPQHSALLGVWGGEGLVVGCVIRRNMNGEIDLLAGPRQIHRWAGPLGGDWYRDIYWLTQQISEKVAPVHVGVHGTIEQWQRLLHPSEPRLGAWLKAVTLREIVIDPMPPYIKAALATDAMRLGLSQMRIMLRKLPKFMVPSSLLSEEPSSAFASTLDLVLAVRSQWQTLASVTKALGFNPLDILIDTKSEQPDLGRRDK